MKKALEIALVVAVVGIGAYVARAWRVRREIESRPPTNAAIESGADLEDPYAPPPPPSARHGVTSVPMVRTTLPKKRPHKAAVPPAPVQP